MRVVLRSFDGSRHHRPRSSPDEGPDFKFSVENKLEVLMMKEASLMGSSSLESIDLHIGLLEFEI